MLRSFNANDDDKNSQSDDEQAKRIHGLALRLLTLVRMNARCGKFLVIH